MPLLPLLTFLYPRLEAKLKTADHQGRDAMTQLQGCKQIIIDMQDKASKAEKANATLQVCRPSRVR